MIFYQALLTLFVLQNMMVFLLSLKPLSQHCISFGTKRRILSELSAKTKLPIEEKSFGSEESKIAALEGVLHQIERTFGKGSIQLMGKAPSIKVETTTSGSLTLDLALGGGYPRGRVVEIYGPEASGKTTLALHAIAGVQAGGGIAAFIDAEHALDPVYAKKLGVNVDGLVLCQPDSGEMALEIVDQLVRSSACDMVVIDSVAALVPRAELEGDMSDMQVGLQARLMSKALRKLTGSLSRSKTTVIFINQLRSKVGVMYGNPEVTAGGNALKFYSSVRLDIRRREVLKDGKGTTVKVKVVKNKVAAPYKTVEFDLLFGQGIDTHGCMVDAAEELGVIVRRGSWYSAGENRFAQGKQAAVEYFKMNDEFAASIELAVREKIASKLIGIEIGTEDDIDGVKYEVSDTHDSHGDEAEQSKYEASLALEDVDDLVVSDNLGTMMSRE